MARPTKTRENEVLLAALACGATKESAAHQAGVSLSTVHRRLADQEFCRELEAFRANLVQRTAAALTAAARNCCCSKAHSTCSRTRAEACWARA